MSDLVYSTQADAQAAADRYAIQMGFSMPSAIRATRKWADVKQVNSQYTIPDPGSWSSVLTFEDDFATFDATKWNYALRYGRTHGDELEYYLDANATVSGGNLILTAKQEASNGYNYTSGAVNTFGKFSQTYGYFEARMQIPSGQGLWPAFWLLPTSTNPWPQDGEIDVMECLGQSPSIAYMTNHYLLNGSAAQTSASYTGSDFSTGFHTFGVLWQKDLLVWYVDGAERAISITGVPSTPCYLILNLAVGGSWPGAPNQATLFPASLFVDWVRVWSV